MLTPNPGNRAEDFIFEKIEKKKPTRLSNLEYLGLDMIEVSNYSLQMAIDSTRIGIPYNGAQNIHSKFMLRCLVFVDIIFLSDLFFDTIVNRIIIQLHNSRLAVNLDRRAHMGVH